MKVMDEVIGGTWGIRSFIEEKNGVTSSEYERSIHIQSLQATPTASIETYAPVNGRLTLHVLPSKSLNVQRLKLGFIENDLSHTLIELYPDGDNSRFIGYMDISESIAPGNGQFVLDKHSLVDYDGNTGEFIKSGKILFIDRTPPSKPGNILVGKD